ncbi:MAG: glycosyltransferase family 4 protein [Candidatus Limiplasma sp.]|nr:glycosyltransferase family 4 protein [Candidatus Limiplasma sp.]
MNRHVLMLADADSFWTRRYIENLLLPEGDRVTLFPIWGDGGTNAEFYRRHGVQVYRDSHTLPLIRHIPRLRMWARIWLNARALRKLGPFDVIHNHYLSQRDLALAGAVARAFPKARWVCSFWGSDLLRASPKAMAQMEPYLRRCHALTLHSALQRDLIRGAYGEAVARKTALVYFGQTGFGHIDDVRTTMTKAQCKAHFGIDPRQRVVCVGYNASPAQHQPEVLDVLAHLSPQELSTITVVLQLTYGGTDAAYLKAVQERAAALPCASVILKHFMDGEESAKLRLAADVFILAIQTDAFSASLQEYLYGGARVVKGEWLVYPQLEELEIETASFADYPEIPALVLDALSKPLTPEEEERRAELKTRYSWDAARGAWLATYREG